MRAVTAIDPSWLGTLAKGSRLVHLGCPLVSPAPQYTGSQDGMLCSVTTKYGRHSWEIAPVRVPWDQAFAQNETNRALSSDDVYTWFARSLLDGKVFPELHALGGMLRQDTAVITNTKVRPKAIQGFLATVQSSELFNRQSVCRAWRDRGPRFLWSCIQPLVRAERVAEAERLWVVTARQYMATA